MKKIEYLVMNGAAIRNESFLPGIMGVGIIPPLSDLDLCLPTLVSLNIIDKSSKTKTVRKMLDPIEIFLSYGDNAHTNVFYNEKKKYSLISQMFKDDRLRELCLETVDIFDVNGQKQSTVRKHDAANAKIESDRCSNTNVTLLYKFKGSRNITVKLGILTKETCPSFIEQHAALIGGMSALIVTVLSIVAIVTFCMRKKKTPEVPRPDLNPVYGTYSRGSMEEGEYGDGDVVEAKDYNPYYEMSS